MNEILGKLKATLKPDRYNHSIGVMNEAVRMAELAGVDKDKARLAGILHDCAKYLTKDQCIKLAEKHNLTLDEDTLLCPPVIHAPIGALVAQYEYGIGDKEVLDAIAKHTVAGTNLTMLSKIVYIADMTEPGRDFDGVDELRKISESDILGAYALAVKSSLLHNIQKGVRIHPMTVYAYNEISSK